MKNLLLAVILTVFSFHALSAQAGMLMPSSWPQNTMPQVLPVPENWSSPPVNYSYITPEFTKYLSAMRKCFKAKEGVTKVLVEQDSVTFKWDDNALLFCLEEDGVWVSGIITPITFGAGISTVPNEIVVVSGEEFRVPVLSQLDSYFKALNCKN